MALPSSWRSRRPTPTAWALTTLASLSAVVADHARPASSRQLEGEQEYLGRDMALMVNEYMHVRYNFALYRQYMHRNGTGELWYSIKDDIPRIRLKGEARSPRFGKAEITVVIDGGTRSMYVQFEFPELHEHQCTQYPFPRITDNSVRMERLRLRRREVLKWRARDGNGLDLSPTTVRKRRVKWTRSNSLEFLLGAGDQILGIDLLRRGKVVKTVRIDSEPESAAHAAKGMAGLFGPPTEECAPEGATAQPLAELDLIPPHRKSSALNDLLLVLADRAANGPGSWPQSFVLISTLAVPGDVAIMIEDPEPPRFARLGSVSFTYTTEVVSRGIPLSRTGSTWLDLKEQTFRLRGEAKETKVGPLSMDFLAQGDHRGKIYANVNLTAQEEHQCVAYDYPSLNSNASSQLRRVSGTGLLFSAIAELRGEDCSIFKAPLARGQWIHVWVDMEDSRPDAVLRSEIHKGGQVLRTTQMHDWHVGGDVPVAMRPPPEWACGKSPAAGRLARLKLHEVHRRSLDLQDALYALRELGGDFALLEILGLIGDITLVVQEPELPEFWRLPSVSFSYSMYLGRPDPDLRSGSAVHAVGSFAADLHRSRVRLTASSRTPGHASIAVALNPGALAVQVEEARSNSPQCQILRIPHETRGPGRAVEGDRFPATGHFDGVEQIGEAECNHFTFRNTSACPEEIEFWFSKEESTICGIQVLEPVVDRKPGLDASINVQAWEPVYAPGLRENDPHGVGLAAAPSGWNCKEVKRGEGGQWLFLEHIAPHASLPMAVSLTKLAKAVGSLGLLPVGYLNALSHLVVLPPSSIPGAKSAEVPAPPADILRNELRTFAFAFTSAYSSQDHYRSSRAPSHNSPAGSWTRSRGHGTLRVDLANRRLHLWSEAAHASAGIARVESQVFFRGDYGSLWLRTKTDDFEQCWSLRTAEAVPPPRSGVSPNPFRRGQFVGTGFSVPGVEDRVADKYVFYLDRRRRVEFFIDESMSLAGMKLDNLDRDTSVGIRVHNWSTAPIDEGLFEPSSDWNCEDLRFLKSSEDIADWNLIRIFFSVDPASPLAPEG